MCLDKTTFFSSPSPRTVRERLVNGSCTTTEVPNTDTRDGGGSIVGLPTVNKYVRALTCLVFASVKWYDCRVL